MNQTQNNSNSGGIGFFGALFIAFLVLKLTAVIDWSWWWVTAPLWMPAAFFFSIALLIFAVIMSRGGTMTLSRKNRSIKATRKRR